MSPGWDPTQGSSADEVYDLQPVTFMQRSSEPLIAGHDLAVEFDRDTVGLHAELLDQGSKSFGGRGLSFAVDG